MKNSAAIPVCETLRIFTARKEHTCFLCNQPIPPGSKYWRYGTSECEHTNCEEYKNERST